MSIRRALTLLVLVAACDAPPASDNRGTPTQPLEVAVRVQDAPGPQPGGEQALTVKETSNSADVTWRTEVKVGVGQTLTVVPSQGDPVVFRGTPLRAEFYHVGRVLLVTEGEGDAAVFHNFFEPVRWYTARSK
jgi:hypothetical protein